MFKVNNIDTIIYITPTYIMSREKTATKQSFFLPQPQISTKSDGNFTTDSQIIKLSCSGTVMVKIKNDCR